MKAGVKAGLISFGIITLLFAMSYHFELYKLNSIFNLFPLTVAPFFGVFFTIRSKTNTTFIERFKGGIQSSLIAGLLFSLLGFILIKLGFIKHESLDPNNLFINVGMTINIFAISGALVSAIFSALLYKKEKL